MRHLLSTKLDSFEKVELVALLARHPRREDTLDGIARALQVGRDVLERLALDLAKTDLVEVHGEAVRLVASKEDLVTIDEAARIEPTTLVRWLSAIALDRIRGMAARSFADAFTIRKKKDDG